MFGVDVKWKPMEEEEEKKGANASLNELMSLSYLMALKIQIPNIKVLEVGGSDDVEYVMNTTSDQNPHAAFPILESLKVFRLNNLKEIYHGQYPKRSFNSACFGNLKSLCLEKCQHLKNVFSLSIARGLVQLQKLEIDDCDDMEGCFHKEGEDEKALNDNKMFPQLTSIELDSLPRLIGFCTGVGPVELVQPSLNREVGRIGIDEVTNLEKHKMTDIQQHTGPFPKSTPIISHKLFLSNTILWAPNLKYLELWKADSLEVVFDLKGLNINDNHQRIIVLAQLKTLESTLSKLKNPKVNDSDNSSEIWSFIPSYIIECLKNLESIELINVPSPEVLFQLEELNVEKNHMAPILDQLRKLILYGLDNLMHIWKKRLKRILGFGNLRLLYIEEILTRAGEEEEKKDVLFYKVNSIALHKLPNLKCFCSETNALEWPSLKEIRVIECPSLSTFIPSNLDTPKLEGVYDSYWEGEETYHWKGDLNATIENIFKGKEKQANHETQQEEQTETIENDK
uniref:Disease resistance protein At4g27190-like leucine-rich repeats domain-containing protein n=1 Tax=Quercus lobata TaxID=97700 RepID=A0A7N2M364_QUELO